MEKGGFVHKILRGHRSFGERAADNLAKAAGSWTFILIFIFLLILWMAVNVKAYMASWDPYPFILLNLVLSCIAALQAPIILMSQNRQSSKDRIKAEYDYKVNLSAEKGIEEVLKKLKKLEAKNKI
tara:strand:- start:4166 stop:4543 length:378 start_codon:yes stop_codon:yes gene_type:complete